MKKSLNLRAFRFIICGLVLDLLSRGLSVIIVFTTDFKQIINEAGLGAIPIETLRLISIIFSIGIFVVTGLIGVYFIIRLVDNKKAPALQGYITALLVIGIILGMFATFGLFSNLYGLINIAAYSLIITGCVIQRNPNTKTNEEVKVEVIIGEDE